MMWRGQRRLLLLNVPSPVKYLHEKLPAEQTKTVLANAATALEAKAPKAPGKQAEDMNKAAGEARKVLAAPTPTREETRTPVRQQPKTQTRSQRKKGGGKPGAPRVHPTTPTKGDKP